MKKTRLVMVGNGMAGVRTLEELLKIAPDLYDIAVFGAEPHPNYNRILLSPVLAGEQTLEEIVLNPAAWYAEHGIALHLGRKIVAIDLPRPRSRIELAEDKTYNHCRQEILSFLYEKQRKVEPLLRTSKPTAPSAAKAAA